MSKVGRAAHRAEIQCVMVLMSGVSIMRGFQMRALKLLRVEANTKTPAAMLKVGRAAHGRRG